MKTTLHTYSFDTLNPVEAADYRALCTALKSQGLKCFETWGAGKGHYAPFTKFNGQQITLDTSNVFNNQWSATLPDGTQHRVFDWAQDYQTDNTIKHRKVGHYLTITPEMITLRDATYKCGYCGKYHTETEAATLNHLCASCIDSEYMAASDLHLTRLKPVSDTTDRAPLTETEAARLLPIFIQSQTHGVTARGKSRIEQARKDIAAEYEKETNAATHKRDGALWVINRFPNLLKNHIYYSHTGVHCFGWRNPLTDDVKAELLAAIDRDGFPGRYEIK
jgi:hypothetical protein